MLCGLSRSIWAGRSGFEMTIQRKVCLLPSGPAAGEVPFFKAVCSFCVTFRTRGAAVILRYSLSQRQDMLGVLFLPLVALGILQSIVAAFLLAPLPLARPAIRITKQTRTPAGWTVVATVSVILVAFLVSALYEIAEFHGNGRSGSGESEVMHRRLAETGAWLSAVLTSANLISIFVLQKLAAVLAEREQIKASQGALLRQVQGLNMEYERLRKESEGTEARKDASRTASEGPGSMQGLRKEVQSLQERVEQAERAKISAEQNADALKTQSKGLENEYDRLLAEHDALSRRLARFDPSFQICTGKKGM